jgi:hypothetical protein
MVTKDIILGDDKNKFQGVELKIPLTYNLPKRIEIETLKGIKNNQGKLTALIVNEGKRHYERTFIVGAPNQTEIDSPETGKTYPSEIEAIKEAVLQNKVEMGRVKLALEMLANADQLLRSANEEMNQRLQYLDSQQEKDDIVIVLQ